MVPFPNYPYVRKYKIFYIFSISKYFLPWTYCVSKLVVQLPSFYLTVTLQVGTAFGGRSHGSCSIDRGNVSSCTFDAFLHLMFPLKLQRERKVTPTLKGKGRHGEVTGLRSMRLLGQGFIQHFALLDLGHTPCRQHLPEGLRKCACSRNSCHDGYRLASVAYGPHSA